MRTTLALILSTLLALSLVPSGAGAHEEHPEQECRLIRGADTTDDASDDVEVCRQEVWFHQADTKAANLAGQGLDSLPSWDTHPPTTSVAGGAGAGYLGSSLYQVSGENDPTYHPAFEGTYEGPIDTALIDLYLFPPNRMVEQATDQADIIRVDAILSVDGKMIGNYGELHVPLEDGGNAVQRIRFAWQDLYRQLEVHNIDGAGEHTVRLEVVGTGIGTDAALWVFDTSEVPSGIIFNATAEEVDAVAGF